MKTGPREVTTLRVRYEETDQGGVVYHSNYIVYFEVGRTEFMRARGVTYRELEDDGHKLSVVDVGATYHRPAVYDDALCIETRVARVRPASVRFEYTIRRGEELVCTGHTTLACVDGDQRVRRLPPHVRAALLEA